MTGTAFLSETTFRRSSTATETRTLSCLTLSTRNLVFDLSTYLIAAVRTSTHVSMNGLERFVYAMWALKLVGKEKPDHEEAILNCLAAHCITHE